MAFHTIYEPSAQRTAVVFDNPHSGIVLPEHFKYACTREDLMHLHDPHIEKLLVDIPATGAPVLEMHIHRTCIDLNRFLNEVSPDIIAGPWPHGCVSSTHTEEKLSLFPVYAGPRWNRIFNIYSQAAPLTVEEAELRVDTYYRPYYLALGDLMNQAAQMHGQALLVDVHSSFRRPEHASCMADIILGDMEGTTCSPCTLMETANVFKNHGLTVSFNGKYFSGGAVIRKTAEAADAGHHSLQIEISRDTYMDQDTLAYDDQKAQRIKNALGDLSLRLAKHMIA